MITWKDTISLILAMFDRINQQELANLLGVSESTLPKIKLGKRDASFNSEAVFNRVFNPAMSGSPANDNPQFLLETLKGIIDRSEFGQIRKELDDCWSETDYKAFVMTLLNRTRNGVRDRSASVPECLPQEDSVVIPAVRYPSVRSRILPHSDDKCCFYCAYWRGERDTIGAYLTKAYGFCRKYNRENQLSSSPGCAEYKRIKT